MRKLQQIDQEIYDAIELCRWTLTNNDFYDYIIDLLEHDLNRESVK